MKRYLFFVVAASLSALLMAGCGGGGGGKNPGGGTSGSSLSGRVVQVGTGTPLQGVTVSSGSAHTTTNANGEFSLSGLTSGAATVYVQLSQYEMSYAKVTIVGTSNSIPDDIEMAPTASHPTGSQFLFRGCVKDYDTNEPVVGAVVKVGTTQTETTTNGRFWMELPTAPVDLTYSVNGSHASPAATGYFSFWAYTSNGAKNATCLKMPLSPATGVDIGTIKLQNSENVPPFPPSCGS